MPDFNIPQGLLQGAASETGLGQYGTALLNPLAAMTGWASSIATGQNVNVPSAQAFAVQAGPGVLFHGQGKEWSSSFDPTSGLITFTNPGNPRQTFVSTIQQAQNEGFDIPQGYLTQWQNAQAAYQQYQTGQGGTYGGVGGAGAGFAPPPVTASKLPASGSVRDFQTWYSANLGKTVYVNGQPRTISEQDLNPDQALAAYSQGGLSWQAPGTQQQLALGWQDIQAQQAATGQMSGIEAQTQGLINQTQTEGTKYQQQGDVQEQQAQALYGVGYNELSAADKQIVDANALVAMTTTGQGLFPAQTAMIEQARQSEETQLASTLGGAGLGRSTQLSQLSGAADLAAAATAGQLQQGNIQAAEQVVSGALGQQAGAQKTLGLAQTQEQVAQQSYQLSQAAEKLTIAGQTLLTAEQAQLSQELSNITSQSVQFQQTMWNEAMQGYGMMGNIISTSAQSYGYSLQAYQSVLQAEEEHAQLQAQANQQAQAADQQANSSLFSGIGQLFGSTGALGASGAFGASGALAGVGSAISGIFSAFV